MPSSLKILNSLLLNKQYQRYLQQHIALRAGVEGHLVALDESAVIVDEIEDRFVARFAVKKHEIASQVVRDLIVVEAIMDMFRSLWTEPEWSPYP